MFNVNFCHELLYVEENGRQHESYREIFRENYRWVDETPPGIVYISSRFVPDVRFFRSLLPPPRRLLLQSISDLGGVVGGVVGGVWRSRWRSRGEFVV